MSGTPTFLAFETRLVAHDASVTRRVAQWAYRQAERAGSTVWQEGRVPLEFDRQQGTYLLTEPLEGRPWGGLDFTRAASAVSQSTGDRT